VGNRRQYRQAKDADKLELKSAGTGWWGWRTHHAIVAPSADPLGDNRDYPANPGIFRYRLGFVDVAIIFIEKFRDAS
jgi:hypothetical protein